MSYLYETCKTRNKRLVLKVLAKFALSVWQTRRPIATLDIMLLWFYRGLQLEFVQRVNQYYTIYSILLELHGKAIQIILVI